jgi:hypothetical protein
VITLDSNGIKALKRWGLTWLAKYLQLGERYPPANGQLYYGEDLLKKDIEMRDDYYF